MLYNINYINQPTKTVFSFKTEYNYNNPNKNKTNKQMKLNYFSEKCRKSKSQTFQ